MELVAPAAKPRLTRAEASKHLLEAHGLSVAVSTLASLASKGGGGPLYNKAGSRPLYPVAELDAWAQRRLGQFVRNSTQAKAQAARAA